MSDCKHEFCDLTEDGGVRCERHGCGHKWANRAEWELEMAALHPPRSTITMALEDWERVRAVADGWEVQAQHWRARAEAAEESLRVATLIEESGRPPLEVLREEERRAIGFDHLKITPLSDEATRILCGEQEDARPLTLDEARALCVELGIDPDNAPAEMIEKAKARWRSDNTNEGDGHGSGAAGVDRNAGVDAHRSAGSGEAGAPSGRDAGGADRGWGLGGGERGVRPGDPDAASSPPRVETTEQALSRREAWHASAEAFFRTSCACGYFTGLDSLLRRNGIEHSPRGCRVVSCPHESLSSQTGENWGWRCNDCGETFDAPPGRAP